MSSQDDRQDMPLDRTEQQLDNILSTAMHRQDCPDSMQIGHYELGMLKEKEQEQVRDHLKRCSYCREELANMTDLIATEEWYQAPGIEWRWTRLGEFIVRLLRPPAPSAFAYATRESLPESAQKDAFAVRSIKLGVDHIEDVDLTATIYENREVESDSPGYGVRVRVVRPSRIFENLSGTRIRAMAGEWHVEGVTDEEGIVQLLGLPKNRLEELQLQVKLDSG